jgi:hypothetical protein
MYQFNHFSTQHKQSLRVFFYMVGHALSLQRRRQQAADERAQLKQEVLTRYASRTQRTIGGPKRPRGMHTIYAEVSNAHAAATGRRVLLSSSTLLHCVNGRPSKASARRAQAHLSKAEAEVICGYVVELAKQGFPLSHRRL